VEALMSLDPIALFIVGAVIVVLGAEMVLGSATRLAIALKVKPIVIGLTVVSVGTSFPELAIGVIAAVEGKGSLAVGNIAGTNILNILFILGLSAVIRPLPTRLMSIKLDVPVMIASATALLVMSLDGVITRVEGLLLFVASIVYTYALIKVSADESAFLKGEFAHEFGDRPPGSVTKFDVRSAVILVAGIVISIFGAHVLVTGAVEIAREFHVSDAFIGLTIVAIGTSAPELVTTVLATLKDDRDVAIGNLIGSSIYNILVILAVTAILAPTGLDVSAEILKIDLPLAAVVALVCWPVFSSERCVSRLEGALFLTSYLIYLAMLLQMRS
jgi:cation:H+ antiporter